MGGAEGGETNIITKNRFKRTTELHFYFEGGSLPTLVGRCSRMARCDFTTVGNFSPAVAAISFTF